MATWAETREHLQRTLTIAVDQPDWLGLGWKFKSPARGVEVLQRQKVHLAEAFGEPHLIILCDIVTVDQVPPRTFLEHNMTLGIGAIAITGEDYVLRAILPLANLEMSWLDRMLEYVAHEAARLRDTVTASA